MGFYSRRSGKDSSPQFGLQGLGRVNLPIPPPDNLQNALLLFSGARMAADPMKPNLRIAINALTLPANLAGTGFYLRMLVEKLLEEEPGLAITVFTNREAAKGLGDLAGVDIVGVSADSILAKVLWSQLILPLRLGAFDVVHSIGNVGLLFCSIPQVVTIHDLCQRMVPDRFGLLKRVYLNAGQAWSAWTVARAITVSASTRRDLIQYHPRYLPKVTTILSASKFPVTEAGPEARTGFLFVGTLEPGKRLELAIEALGRIKRGTGRTKTLSVVGAKGWKHTHLPALIDRLDLRGQIEFLGYLSEAELRQRYREAECLIFPSIYEGFGFPILEAQSQGCPVISADNSSLREVGGDGCHYFRTQDIEGLIGLLEMSQTDRQAFQSLRAAGYRNCLRFDWNKTAAATLDVYRQVAPSTFFQAK
jgi:glycosyltransferase involved in cell wall biosynthesis